MLVPGFLRAVNDGPTPLGSPTHFRAQGSLGGVTTYTWDFGDGKSAQGDVLTHTYAAAGTFTATVQAANGVDNWSASTTVTVTTDPVPGWTSGSTPGFGSAANQVVSGLGVYNQALYAGTTNDGGAQLWKKAASGPELLAADWTSLINPGFGNAKNTGINHLFVYGNRLYASTVNETQGGEIWMKSRQFHLGKGDIGRLHRRHQRRDHPPRNLQQPVVRRHLELQRRPRG